MIVDLWTEFDIAEHMSVCLVSHYEEPEKNSKFTQWGWICLEVVAKMYLENEQEQVKALIGSC